MVNYYRGKGHFFLLYFIFLTFYQVRYAHSSDRHFDLSNKNSTIHPSLAPTPIILGKDQMTDVFKANFLRSPIGLLITKGKKSLIPETLYSVVHNELDVPIEYIQDLHEKSYTYWKNIDINNSNNESVSSLSNNGQFEEAQIDLIGMKELNLKAYEIWNSLAECHYNSPKRVRLAFFYCGLES